MKIVREKGGIIAWHGTDRSTFAAFDFAPLPPSDPRQRTFERLQYRWLAADDNPRFARDPSLYDAFNRRLNVSIRNLFRSLGYAGPVYANEIESPSDSYVIFSTRQVKILAAESVDATLSKGMAA